MRKADINGVSIAYEIVGDGRKAAIITPGGRLPKEARGIRELAAAIAHVERQL